MQETGNNKQQRRKNRLTIRVSRFSMSFSVADAQAENQLIFEPYDMKSGVSAAANLREAFATSRLLSAGYDRARLMVDANVMLIPTEEFSEDSMDLLYRNTFTSIGNSKVCFNVMPELNAVAVFAVDKDLRMVIGDHFSDVRVMPVSQPVWTHLYKKSFQGPWKKMYGYFHDRKLDIVSYQKGRFRFVNTFETDSAHDALYFLMYVWKQLGMDSERDEMHIVGTIPQSEWLLTQLRSFVQKAYVINPSADFNRAPVTRLRDLPYDLITLYLSH